MKARERGKRQGGTIAASTDRVRVQEKVLSLLLVLLVLRKSCTESVAAEREREELGRAIVDRRTARNERKLQVIEDGANTTAAFSFFFFFSVVLSE